MMSVLPFIVLFWVFFYDSEPIPLNRLDVGRFVHEVTEMNKLQMVNVNRMQEI